MRTRFIITLLLVCVMSLTTIARPLIASESLRSNSEGEPKLSKREEREALELAAHFSERLRETNDFGQIIDELCVRDFAERLKQAEGNVPPLWFLNKSLIAEASPAELRRYYVAAMNFFSLFYSLAEASAHPKEKAEDGEAEDVETELNFEEVLPPEVMSVLASDPTLAWVIQELRKDEENESAKEDDSNQPAPGGDSTQAASATSKNDDDDSTEKSKIEIIKSLSQLKSISETVEKAIELMRTRLASLPVIAKAEPKGDASKVEPETQNLMLVVPEGNYFGCPKGTPVIHVDARPFCLTMIRSNGQLKILSVVLYEE